jgi:lysophospholipase L1-like esterase
VKPSLVLRALSALVALSLPAAAPQAKTKVPAKSVRKAPGTKGKAPSKKPPEGAAIEGTEALAPFFESLRTFPAAMGEDPTTAVRVRISFLGDSHTAAGFWPGRLRTRLQERLGDGGPGLVLPARPWRGYPRMDLDQEFGRRWPAASLRSAAADGRVGLPGAALEIPTEERLVLRGNFETFRLHLLGTEEKEPIISRAGSGLDLPLAPILLKEIHRQPLGGELFLHILEPSAAGPIGAFSLGLPEGMRLLGVDLLSGKSGAVVDELGLNGAELTDLERWDPALRAALFADTRPSLLVLAFGTNDLGRRDLDGSAYRTRAARLLKALKEASGAPVLLVGPLDRLGRRRRGQNLKLGAKTVVEAMRGACSDAGCAFWDAKAAMGGEGSIQGWRKLHLAQRDLVHLTVGGYQKLGDLLLQALEKAEADHGRRLLAAPSVAPQ